MVRCLSWKVRCDDPLEWIGRFFLPVFFFQVSFLKTECRYYKLKREKKDMPSSWYQSELYRFQSIFSSRSFLCLLLTK